MQSCLIRCTSDVCFFAQVALNISIKPHYTGDYTKQEPLEDLVGFPSGIWVVLACNHTNNAYSLIECGHCVSLLSDHHVEKQWEVLFQIKNPFPWEWQLIGMFLVLWNETNFMTSTTANIFASKHQQRLVQSHLINLRPNFRSKTTNKDEMCDNKTDRHSRELMR